MSIKKLYIDQTVIDEPLTALFRSRTRASVEIVDNAREVFKQVTSSDDPIQKGKEVLFLTRNKGAFVRACPGTSSYCCCDYMILHIGSYCVMDCSYCILQTYFHPPVLTFFVNQSDLLAELKVWLSKKEMRRIGTGEFTDSMIWENQTGLSRTLIPYFAKQSYTALELKTKTTAIDNLAKLEHNRKIIMSWSLNTPTVIAHQERHTASLASRLKAAAKCAQQGYPLAFHFDPMIIYKGCEAEYRHVADLLFENIASENIVWISLGAFRFIPALKPIIQKRFAHSKILYGEFITGLDNKMRYFKPLRIELYRQIIDRIREHAPDVTLYFCMEDDEVWAKTLGYTPSEYGGLGRILDDAAILHCGLDA
ncbi:DNA photolyase [Desulfococcaceae bacterium HSG7]|nr:DNA photolyase [Desulfococcaceae bacterium HSG7]